jgi:hypothetical protein
MPVLTNKVEGKGNGVKTVLPNVVDVARAVSRPPTCEYDACGTAGLTATSDLTKFFGNVSADLRRRNDGLNRDSRNWAPRPCGMSLPSATSST